MEEIKGKYNTAISFAKIIEDSAREQIRRMCNYEFTKDSKIRIMPDVHAGKGCTIGTTMTVTDKAVPNIVGVDIGCGMYTVKLSDEAIDFERVDAAAHYIPSRRNVWDSRQEKFDLTELHCYRELKETRWIEKSLGTLGGGNHFIEIDKAADGTPAPIFSLTDINRQASDAGYYFPALSEVPEDAIAVTLERDYSDAPPAGLMEEAGKVRGRSGRTVGALAYAKAELLPRLRGRLPGGLPYGRLCAWALGIALFVYLFLRYFISWKPVHKQAFQAFEDMFCLAGCLALYCAALLDGSMSRHPLSWFWIGMFPVCSIILLAQAQWQERSPFASRPARVKRKVPRFVYALLGGLFYVLAFRLIRFESHDLIHVAGVGFFVLAVAVFLDLNQGRIVKPVQPGLAIPLAFILGVAASLAVFAVCLLFPSGPAVFAALLCFRIVFLEN